MVQEFRGSRDPESRTNLLVRMREVLNEMDDFTSEYLKSAAGHPASSLEADAVRIVRDFLSSAASQAAAKSQEA
jgi:hypothetical protein